MSNKLDPYSIQSLHSSYGSDHLVVGATGNTERGVVETFSGLLKANNTFSGHRILALTRSLSGATAQQLAELPNVLVAEKIGLISRPTGSVNTVFNAERAFIASHIQPNQFAEESTFHLAALKGGVQYVVRVSTTAANVRPDCPAYYPRTHWTIEPLLGSPEFQDLRWTSLQPNIFSQQYLYSAAELVKKFRVTGNQDTLRLVASGEAPVGIIDPYEIGVLARQLTS
jgi:hypothetical protein